MERDIVRTLATRTRGNEVLYEPTVIWVDPNDSREDKSPLAVLIVLTVLVGTLLIIVILVGVELWRRNTGRRPMLPLPGFGYIVPGGRDDDERVATRLNTRRPDNIPATPTTIPPTPLAPAHLGEITRTGEGEVHSQQPDESTDSFNSGLGEVHHGRRISFSRAPASLHSSSLSKSASLSRSHPLSIFQARINRDADKVAAMEALASSDSSREPGDLTILVSPPTPSTTSNASSVHLPSSISGRGEKLLDFSLNRTPRQVDSRHTLLLNDLSPASPNEVGEAYQRAAYEDPEDLYALAIAQPLDSSSSYSNHGNPTNNFLSLPHLHDDVFAQEGRLPSLEDRYDPENTDPFRKSSPEIPPLAHDHPARSTAMPAFSSSRKDLSMNQLVRHMMTMPTPMLNPSNSRLSVTSTGTHLRSRFSPSSTILPLPEHEEESFLAKSTAVVKKVWKNALGLGLGRKTGSEGRVEKREDVLNDHTQSDARGLQHPTRTTSLLELPLINAPDSAGSKSSEESPSLSQTALDPERSVTPPRPTHQDATLRSPMIDSSNLSKYYTPATTTDDLKKMKSLPSQPLRTPSKVHHHSRVVSSPFFLQASPRVVPVRERTRDAIHEEATAKQELSSHRLSEPNGLPNSLSSAYSDDRRTSFLLSSAGFSEWPSPPIGTNFRNHQRKSSEFTLDRDYRLSEPVTGDHGQTTMDARSVPQEVSIYDEWNSYLPTTPRSLEDLDPRLFEASDFSSPGKRVKLSGQSPVPRQGGEVDGEDGEVIGSMPAGGDDRVRSRPDAPLETAFTPFQTSTPVKSVSRRNSSEQLG
ncbi:hypothetical protein FS837_004212 [Tulasnella sp. UAMH 9824]|nr:hypothetical protein FS837_004212 [Tulasnella sp. UAMH 9824]